MTPAIWSMTYGPDGASGWRLLWVSRNSHSRRFGSRAPKFVLDAAGVDSRGRVNDPRTVVILTRFAANGAAPPGMRLIQRAPKHIQRFCELNPASV